MMNIGTPSIRRALTVLLLVAATASPASADHESDLPLVFSGAMGRYTSITMDVTLPAGRDADTPVIDIIMRGTGSDIIAEGFGVWAYYPDGEWAWGINETLWDACEVYIAAPAPVGIVADARLVTSGTTFSGVFSVYGFDVGRLTLVIANVFDATSVSGAVRISADAGVEVHAITLGSEGFMLRERAFRHQVHVGTPAIAASVSGTTSVTTHGALFGNFGNASDVNEMSYHGPAGSRPAPTFLEREPSGTHTFVEDRSLGVTNDGVWAWGVDVDPAVLPVRPS